MSETCMYVSAKSWNNKKVNKYKKQKKLEIRGHACVNI